MSYMFYRCKSLISLPYISKLDTSHVKDMSYMFYSCNSLILLPDISKWDISNVNNMNNMFSECKSSIKLPDFYIFYKYKNNIIFELTYQNNKNKGKISIIGKKFIKKNLNKCSIIYNNCEYELKEYFEDIDNNHNGKFKLLLCLDKNINDISYIFDQCKSLVSVEFYQFINHLNKLNELNDT